MKSGRFGRGGGDRNVSAVWNSGSYLFCVWLELLKTPKSLVRHTRDTRGIPLWGRGLYICAELIVRVVLAFYRQFKDCTGAKFVQEKCLGGVSSPRVMFQRGFPRQILRNWVFSA